MEKDLSSIPGFMNRHINQLPSEKCIMKVVFKDTDCDHIHICEWLPNNRLNTHEGYLGSAKVIESEFHGICFNAWEQNNSDFVHYVVIQ
jgi:hypothetical protein